MAEDDLFAQNLSEVNFQDATQEFWFHVSAQEELPLAGEVQADLDLERASRFFKSVAAAQAANRREAVADLLLQETALFSEIRQFLGISDKRAYLDLSYIASRMPHPKNETSLCGCQPWTLSRHPLAFFIRLLDGANGKGTQREVALMLADYLLKHGLEMAAPEFAQMSIGVLEMLYARLISPREYQQRAAKRRGHGCEAALALVLEPVGVDLVPADKASNPMGARDPNVDLTTMEIVNRTAGATHSFDLIIRNEGHPRVLMQSLIHTSDPGQYGVNKSDETVEINRQINLWTSKNQDQPIELWALLDGVGFSENKPYTINKLLANVEHFIQLKSLFKAPLRAHKLGLANVEAISFRPCYSKQQIKQLRDLYVPEGVAVLPSEAPGPTNCRAIAAGNATIFVKN